MGETPTDGLTSRVFGWLRRTVVNLSERQVDEALDTKEDQAIDFEILLDDRHPKHCEMLRRYHRMEAREDPND
jgi:hypothetical protein